MSGLRVEERRGARALAELRDSWRALFDEVDAPPFLSWEWCSTWHRHLAPQREPRILCAYRGDRLVGLLPLAQEIVPVIPGAEVRRLAFLGERWGGADYLDLLCPAGEEAPAGEAIFRHLAGMRDFDLIDLDGIAAESLTPDLVARSFPSFRVTSSPRFVCPHVELGASWREVLRASRRAENFKRRLRQIRAVAGFERRVVRAPEEAVAAFERFLALHDARWACQGGSDAMGRPAIRAFHREAVVRLAERGWLHFEELWAEGACRASIYGIDAGATYCFYQSGYDPAWARRSVGLVLLGLSIEDAIARRVRRYDFLRGTEPYKYDWATGSRETVATRVLARNLPAALLVARENAEAAARATAHALLPPRAVDLIRRLRRSRERGAGAEGRVVS